MRALDHFIALRLGAGRPIVEALALVDLQLARWKRADPDLPLLAEARALRARLAIATSAPKGGSP